MCRPNYYWDITKCEAAKNTKQMKFLRYLFLLLLTTPLVAQNTVGLLSYQPAKTYDGYNLLYPHNQPNVYLLDNCGEVVHVWEDDTDFRPGNTAYLLEDGRLVKTKRPAAVAGNPIWAGGGGAIVEIRSWDNDLLWSFERNDEFERLHHDIAITPEETILMIVWENKTREEAIQAGRDSMLLPDNELWPDYILEVDPETDEIVWELRMRFGGVLSEWRIRTLLSCAGMEHRFFTWLM